MNATERLVEETAVIRLMDTYTDALNHKDLETLLTVFLPDASWGTINFRDIRFNGATELRAGFKGIIEGSRFLVQMRGPTIVTINGDTATTRATMQEAGDIGGSFFCFGTYMDKVKKVNGAWKFAERRFRYTYWQEGTMTGQAFSPITGEPTT